MFRGAALVWLVFLLWPAQAAVTLNNSVLTVTTNELSVSFQGMNVQSITNSVTGESYISQPGPGWMDLNTREPTGQGLQPGSWQLQTDPATGTTVGVISASDSNRTVTLTVGVAPDSDEIFFRLGGSSTTPGVRSVLWGIQGLDPMNRLVLPGQAGIYFDVKSTRPRLGLEYPTHWEAQFAFYESPKGGLLIYARDPRPYFKRLQASRELGTLDLALEVFALAPWPKAVEVPLVEWRMKSVRGSWKTAVDHYRHWSEQVWASRAPNPARDWTRSIRSVIVIVDPRLDYLDVLPQRVDPQKTLLYFVNWRRDAYDVNYPDYTPSADVGPFIARARELGFHTMLHMSALGVAQYHPAYADLKQYQLRDPDTEELIFWPWGLWPGGAPPPDYLPSFAFISPAAAAYRKMFLAAVQPAIDALHPDAVHLDAGGVMLNDANGELEGMTSIEGMVQLHKDFRERYPDVALSYESMTEALAPFHDFAQRWNSDYPSHPISTYLMGGEVNFYGFLDQENPDEPGFLNYIRRYESQGIMPTIRIHSMDDLSEKRPITSSIFRMMRLFQQYEFRPDWEGDWTGLQFRYISQDGSTTAAVEDQDSVVRMKVADEVIYERARRTSTLTGDAFIRNWTAYDQSTLFGLDPDREYWLNRNVARPEDQVRLAALPPTVKLGTDTLATNRYGYFELSGISPSLFDFAAGFRESKSGIIYQAKDYSMQAGALALITRTEIAGAVKSPVLITQPPYRILNAAVYVEYQTPLPNTDRVFLNFSAGISDFAPRGDGALFVVRVNGTDVWRQSVPRKQLVTVKADLSRWAGQTVKIRFIVHPGGYLNPTGDLACWADLSLSAESNNRIPFQIVLPSGAGVPSYSAALRVLDDSSRQAPTVELDTPGHFVAFATEPPKIGVDETLLDLPYDVWQQGYGGWATPNLDESTGKIVKITAGDEIEERALVTIPATKAVTRVVWPVRLKPEATRLDFKVALADPSPPLPLTLEYSGVKFSLRINGEEIWSTEVRERGWKPESLDISKWQGQNVLIELVTDSLSNAIFDWAHWAGLTVR